MRKTAEFLFNEASEIFLVGEQDSAPHGGDILTTRQTVKPCITEGPAGPPVYRRPEALCRIINQVAPRGSGDLFQPNQVRRHPVKARWNNAKGLVKVESCKRIVIQVEGLWVHVA